MSHGIGSERGYVAFASRVTEEGFRLFDSFANAIHQRGAATSRVSLVALADVLNEKI
jgi:hypothetical protein